MTDEHYSDPKGVCMFAYNNDKIDYMKLSVICATYIKENLKVPVCLITDEGSLSYFERKNGIGTLSNVFDYLILTDDDMKSNVRRHYDSPYYEFNAQFNNSNKHKVYEYSPFEKTLLIDIDYIVRSDYLNHCWDTYEGVAMFRDAIDIRGENPHPDEIFLSPNSIKMWWSTVIYFDRSEQSRTFFDMWAHVADNYTYYQLLYKFPGHLFRTDYCVSIAIHTLNGMQEGTEVSTIGVTPMLFMTQKDDIVEIKNKDSWVALSNDRKTKWLDICVKTTGVDIHVMNKRALDRNYAPLLGVFDA